MLKKIKNYLYIIILLATGCKNVFSGVTIIDNEPPENPKLFTAKAGSRRAELTWINPADDDFKEVVITRTTDYNPLSTDKEVRVYNGRAQALNDKNLINNIKYYYTIYATDTSGNRSEPVMNMVIPKDPADTTAPAPVTNLTRVATDTTVTFTWTNPADTDFAGVKIMRSDQAYPTVFDDKLNVYNAKNNTFTDNGLTRLATYYYLVFTYDNAGNYSQPVFVLIIPGRLDNQSPGEVTNLQAMFKKNKIIFTWTNPADADLSGIKIISQTGKYPDNVMDGIPVMSGLAATCTIDYVNKNTFYKVFTYDNENPANVSVGVPAVVLFDTPCDIPGLDVDCCN